LWSRRTLFEGVILTTLLIFILIYFGKIGEFSLRNTEGIRWSLLIQLSLMAASGASIIALAWIDFWKSRDADSLLLGLWVIGIFIFAGIVNWTINVRGMLLLVPPAAILLMRQIARRGNGHKTVIWRIAWPLVPAAIIAVSVTWADYTWARTARSAAAAIHKGLSQSGFTSAVWFQGHWGFQYYMEEGGCVAFDFEKTLARPGDMIVVPLNNTNIKPLAQEALIKKYLIQLFPFRWAATMSNSSGAGFYADVWGPLPFIIGRPEPEKYYIFVVKQEGAQQDK